jgi:hypothetical protein
MFYLLLAGLTNVVSNTLAISRINNCPLLHAYTAVEFVFFALFYQMLLRDSKMGRVVRFLIPAFPILCVVNGLFFQSIYTFNSYTKSLEAVTIIFFAIAYFVRMLDKMSQGDAETTSLVYINAGLLLYFAGSLVLFIIPNIIGDRALGWTIWKIHGTILVLMYLLFAVALWKHKK